MFDLRQCVQEVLDLALPASVEINIKNQVSDIKVLAYHSNIPDDALNILYKDSFLMGKSLKENLCVNSALVQVVSNGYKVSAQFSKNPDYLDFIKRYKKDANLENLITYSILDEGTSLVILSGEAFKLMSEGLGIDEVGIGSSVLTLVLVVMVMVIQVLLVISKDNNESIVEGMRKIC